MRGRIEAIHVAARTGAPMVAVDSVECREDFGLVGDRYARAGAKGQVTLVSREKLDEAARDLGTTILPGATRRNVTIAGVELPEDAGARLRLGPVLLEVFGPAAPCGLMDECIMPGAREALVGRSGVRAQVVEGGTLRVGDVVMLEFPTEAVS
jgi:MOSC domain-containing protein YiiM